MSFDTAKFLMLTVMLAGSGAAAMACSGDDDKKADGADAGEAGQSSAGSSSNQAGSSSNAGEQAGGNAAGGAGGNDAGGSDAGGGGGQELGGAGGVANGGEGGGGVECLAHDPSVEDGCALAPMEDCGAVLPNEIEALCWRASSAGVQSGVLQAFAECGQDENVDVCDPADAQACWDQAAERACITDLTITTCTAILPFCEVATAEECQPRVALLSELFQEYVVGCMDPAGETYDPTFEGTCLERLDLCVIPSPGAVY
jgi:hypothetical protein